MARVLVAVSEPITRTALIQWLREAGHEVVGEAEDGTRAQQLARSAHADLALLDLDLARLSGLEVLQRIRSQKLPVKVILIGGDASAPLVQRCVASGANALVSRTDGPSALFRVIADTLAGRSTFPDVNGLHETVGGASPFQTLTNRELTIFRYLARGFPNNAIARELSLSEKTISSHRKRLELKLGARSVVDLLDVARQHGLVSSSGSGPGHPLLDVESREIETVRAMVAGTPFPVHVRDREGKLIACNEAFLTLHETTFDDVVGKRVIDVDWFPPHVASELHATYVDRVVAGRPTQTEVEIERSGRRVVLHTWANPYRNEQGELLGMVCGTVDVTGRADMARALWLEREESELAGRYKSKLLLSMCTHLRPTIEQLAETLQNAKADRLPAMQQERLANAQGVSARLYSMLVGIEDMLNLEYGELSLTPVATDCRALLEGIVNSMGDEATSRGVTICKQFDIPTEQLSIDANRVERILRSLLRQTILLHPGGVVSVSATFVHGHTNAGDLVVHFEGHHSGRDPHPILAFGIELNMVLSRYATELLKGSLRDRSTGPNASDITFRLSV